MTQEAPKVEELLAEVEAELNTITVDTEVRVRNATKREVDVRLAPFGKTIETVIGPEVIERGAFAGMAHDSMLLMGLEHEVHIGIGQDGHVKHVQGRPHRAR
jgi:hypothetical protein